MAPRLVIATRNPGKFRELVDILGDTGFELVSLADLGIDSEIEESGTSYLENARLKATGYARLTGLPTIADDSGIEADALDGQPGYRSARFGGDHVSDEARNRLLREAIEASGRPERGLVFRCVTVLADADGEIIHTEGAVRGELAPAPAGHNGFGYDPIFYLPERGCTTAELTPAAKHAISHRGQAARALAAWLRQHPDPTAWARNRLPVTP